LALIITAVVSGSAFLVGPLNPVTRTGEAQPRVSPLTTYPGAEVDPSLSPDASQVVFAWNGERRDVFHIYVQAVGATSARRLTSDPAEEISPAWSPDGRSIAFLRRVEPRRAAVVIASASGGAERRLTTINSSPPEGWFGALLDWHPGGDWIAASEVGSAASAQALVLISTRNGSMHRITNPAQPMADLGPAFRPDGGYLSFVRLVTFGTGTLYGLSLDEDMRPAGEPVLLHAPADSVAASPAWRPDASEVLFLSGPSFVPELRITRLHPESGKSKVVPFTTARQISAVRRSAEHAAGVFAVVRETVDENIWRFRHRLGGDAGTQFRALVESTWGDNDAHFSPDGKRIVFRSARSGSWEIWVSDSDGSNAVRLTDFRGAQVGAARWSPDGRLIALHARPGGQGDVYVVSPDGGLPQRMTKDPAQDTAATWSNDSRHIYFTSDRGGRSRLLRMPVGDENPVEITESGGFAAAESLDGKWLYFIMRGPAFPTLVRKPLSSAGPHEVVTPLINLRAFELVEDGLYFIPPPGRGEPAVVQFLGNDGRPTEVARLPKPATYGLSVFPRTRAPERIVLYTQKDRIDSDLFIAEGYE
jgi:Tol biopolymer transport system component